MNETTVTITGNMITDVTKRRIGEGDWVANFRVASNERRYDRETDTWVTKDSLYVSVTCWRRLAHGVINSLTKGDPVVVTGRIFTRGFEVDGQKRSVTEMEATAVGPDLSRCTAAVTRARRHDADSGPTAASIVEPRRAGDADTPGADVVELGVVEKAADPVVEPARRALSVVGAGTE